MGIKDAIICRLKDENYVFKNYNRSGSEFGDKEIIYKF